MLDLTQVVAADKTGTGFDAEQSRTWSWSKAMSGDDDMLVVHLMGFPPLETRAESLPPLEVCVFHNVHLDSIILKSSSNGNGRASCKIWNPKAQDTTHSLQARMHGQLNTLVV
jgi:hypothetical protein